MGETGQKHVDLTHLEMGDGGSHNVAVLFVGMYICMHISLCLDGNGPAAVGIQATPRERGKRVSPAGYHQPFPSLTAWNCVPGLPPPPMTGCKSAIMPWQRRGTEMHAPSIFTAIRPSGRRQAAAIYGKRRGARGGIIGGGRPKQLSAIPHCLLARQQMPPSTRARVGTHARKRLDSTRGPGPPVSHFGCLSANQGLLSKVTKTSPSRKRAAADPKWPWPPSGARNGKIENVDARNDSPLGG